MTSKEREEAHKCLQLGYETYGMAGVRQLAQAMGLFADDYGGRQGTRSSRNQWWWTSHGKDGRLAPESEPRIDRSIEIWDQVAAGMSCDDALQACKNAGRSSFTVCLPAWSKCKNGLSTIFAPGIWGDPNK
jgi:hypothetical protein